MMYGLANASRYGMENSWFFQPKSCCISETYMAIMPSILLTEITSAYALSNRVISDENLVDFARPSWPTNVAVAVSDMLLVSSSFVCGWLITATNCIMVCQTLISKGFMECRTLLHKLFAKLHDTNITQPTFAAQSERHVIFPVRVTLELRQWSLYHVLVTSLLRPCSRYYYTSLLSSYCVHIRPRPHYFFWTCSKFVHVLHAHGVHTTSLSVCTAFPLRCTSSYCVHPVFRTRWERGWVWRGQGSVRYKVVYKIAVLCYKAVKLQDV